MMKIPKEIYELIKEKHSPHISILVISMVSIFAGMTVEYINFLFFLPNGQTFALVSILSVLIVIVPPLAIKYSRFSKTKKLEEAFPRFLSEITSNIKSGMTLPQAIRSINYRHYGAMSEHIKAISAKMSWGVPFNKALMNFCNSTGSLTLRQTTRSIIEAHKSGGTIDTVLEAVSQSLYELEKIKKERSASVYSQMLNGYMIYFIFLGVMVGMARFLLPTFSFTNTPGNFIETLPSIFSSIVVIQGVFAGLTIGKMSEGRLIAGVKHAIVLAVIGITTIVLIL